jgi:hypothetical protein
LLRRDRKRGDRQGPFDKILAELRRCGYGLLSRDAGGKPLIPSIDGHCGFRDRLDKLRIIQILNSANLLADLRQHLIKNVPGDL